MVILLATRLRQTVAIGGQIWPTVHQIELTNLRQGLYASFYIYIFFFLVGGVRGICSEALIRALNHLTFKCDDLTHARASLFGFRFFFGFSLNIYFGFPQGPVYKHGSWLFGCWLSTSRGYNGYQRP